MRRKDENENFNNLDFCIFIFFFFLRIYPQFRNADKNV